MIDQALLDDLKTLLGADGVTAIGTRVFVDWNDNSEMIFDWTPPSMHYCLLRIPDEVTRIPMIAAVMPGFARQHGFTQFTAFGVGDIDADGWLETIGFRREGNLFTADIHEDCPIEQYAKARI